jgi:hypothetical protein
MVAVILNGGGRKACYAEKPPTYRKSLINFITYCIEYISQWAGFTLSAYHHYRCEFEYLSWWCVIDATLCDRVCQWLAAGRWFSSVSSTNKTDRHDITKIVLKVALNTINLTTVLILITLYRHCNFQWQISRISVLKHYHLI